MPTFVPVLDWKTPEHKHSQALTLISKASRECLTFFMMFMLLWSGVIHWYVSLVCSLALRSLHWSNKTVQLCCSSFTHFLFCPCKAYKQLLCSTHNLLQKVNALVPLPMQKRTALQLVIHWQLNFCFSASTNFSSAGFSGTVGSDLQLSLLV